jgi:hypothetical protein
MVSPISAYLIDDNCAPKIPKPALQQYDNYQVYDLYCVDRPFEIVDGHDWEIGKSLTSATDKGWMQSWLAVQSRSVE